jgi:hypothetical protein
MESQQRKSSLLQRAHELRQSLLNKSSPNQTMEAACHDSLRLFDLDLVISQKMSTRTEHTRRIDALLEKLAFMLENKTLDSTNHPQREQFQDYSQQQQQWLELQQQQQLCDKLAAQLKQKEQECVAIAEQLRYCSRLLQFVTEERDSVVLSLRSTVESMTGEREALQARCLEEHDTIKSSFHDIIKNLAAENEMLREQQRSCRCSSSRTSKQAEALATMSAVPTNLQSPNQRGFFANLWSWS